MPPLDTDVQTELLAALGATATGEDLIQAASQLAARGAIGITVTGDALAVAASAAAARTALGATTIGGGIFTAADAAAVLTLIGGASTSDLPDLTVATQNLQTGTAYTLALVDAGADVSMANSSANTVTLPADATVPIPVGSFGAVFMDGAGATTLTGATDVTVNGSLAGSVTIAARYQGVTWRKTAANTFRVSGAIEVA